MWAFLPGAPHEDVTEARFPPRIRAAFPELSNWGRWGQDDDRGTLNYITPEHIQAAARLVRTGRSVSLSLPVNTVAGPDNPRPALHYMIHRHDADLPEGAAEVCDRLPGQ